MVKKIIENIYIINYEKENKNEKLKKLYKINQDKLVMNFSGQLTYFNIYLATFKYSLLYFIFPFKMYLTE